MIAKDAVRLGAPVEAAGRRVRPVLRVRYMVLDATAGFGAVEPLGVLVEEGDASRYYPFDLLRSWDWVAARLED